MAAIEYHLKQALVGKALSLGVRGAKALGRGTRDFGQGFAAPFVQDVGGAAKALSGAALKKFGPGGWSEKAYKATKGLPMKGMRWEFGGGVPRMLGNYTGNLATYGGLPTLAATAMGGDQAEGAALALAQLRQQYAQIPWYQKAFGGTGPMDNLIQQSDPRILEALNKLYAR